MASFWAFPRRLFATFSTIKREYNSAYVCVVVDGDRVDGLVDGDRVDVPVDVGVDDRGFAIPGQVDGVCRCPL